MHAHEGGGFDYEWPNPTYKGGTSFPCNRLSVVRHYVRCQSLRE